MTYTKSQIDRINSARLAEPGVKYTQDNGIVWVGTYSKRLELFQGSPALPIGASTDATVAERTTPNDTQPVSIATLPPNSSTETKQNEIINLLSLETSPLNINQYNSLELLLLIYEELKEQTKILKKIYQ